MAKRINKLTKAQEAMLPVWRDKWIDIGLRTGETDWDRAEAAVREMYELAGLKAVPIIHVDSPLAGASAAPIAALILESGKKPKNRKELLAAIEEVKPKVSWHYWYGGQLWAAWAAFTSFFVEVCGLELEPKIARAEKAYRDLAESACYLWPNERFALICARPVTLFRNREGRLHRDGARAIEWPDGWGLFMLNGVRVSDWLVMTPAEQIDVMEFAKISNAEVRREFVRKVGAERLVQKLGAKVVDSSDDGMYELLVVDLGGETKSWPYLKMKNPSIGCWHLEAVDRSCRTVDAALTWRNRTPVRPKTLT